jgi:ABC-type cobalt transport system substrate-binding protein
MAGKQLIGAIALAAVAGLGVLGLAMATAEREGADSNAMTLADNLRQGAMPKPRGPFFAPNAEQERLLFAAQAAVGAGLAGYGCLAARRRRRN